MTPRWRILHLTAAVAETSGQYNEHCLPLLGERDLAICSFHPPAVETPPELRCMHGGGTSLGYLRALRRALRAEYDVIHVHNARAGVLFLLLCLFRPRLLSRAVYTVQNSYRNYHPGNRLLLVPVFAAYRRVVTCSGAVRGSLPFWLRILGGSRIRVVQNGLDVERVTRAAGRAQRSRIHGSFVVVCVGRLIPIKNPYTVLAAFARVARPGWRLRFIGDGPLREPVLARAREIGLSDSVEVTGLVPRDEVFARVAEADLFISASRGEGLPVAVLEGMACGRPTVLSDIAPHRELVGSADFVPLVGSEDADGFAHELLRLASLGAGERDALGERCRKHVAEHFGLPVMHSALERVYREVCPNPGRERAAAGIAEGADLVGAPGRDS